MKRLIIAAIAGLFLLTSCNLGEDVYTISNLTEYVTVTGEILTDDYNNEFNITEDLTDKGWKTDGKRILAQFDILNRSLDIRFKAYNSVIVQEPVPHTPSEEEEVKDPVEIVDASLSPNGYLNMALKYYAKPETDCPHNIILGYSINERELDLYLIHEGNDENPSKEDKSSLKEHYRVYSFPISGIISSDSTINSIFLRADVLTEEDGVYSVTAKKARLYTSNGTF